MSDITAEERKILMLRANGGGQLVSTPEIDNKLVELGYLDKNLVG
jgi:hypothetical protein